MNLKLLDYPFDDMAYHFSGSKLKGFYVSMSLGFMSLFDKCVCLTVVSI